MVLLSGICINRAIKSVVSCRLQEAFDAVPEVAAQVTSLKASYFHSPPASAGVTHWRLPSLNSVQLTKAQSMHRVWGMEMQLWLCCPGWAGLSLTLEVIQAELPQGGGEV